MITQEDIDAMDDGIGLVERLRGRAESERAIQLNNEAVWDCLKQQLVAFEKKDGTHNAFALRLGLDHRNCAEHGAKLAADWDEAADRIEQLERELAGIRAELDPQPSDAWPLNMAVRALQQALAAEKELADRLYEQTADGYEAYRKARGM